MTGRVRRRGAPTRRDLLLAGGAALVAPAVTSCNLLSTEPSGTAANGDAGQRKGKEAPMLGARVKAGELPSVEKRLPSDPLVIEPTESIGVYGGTWNSWLNGAAAIYVFMVQTGYEPLVRWDPRWEEIIPNLATSWAIEDDGRRYVFTLREGVKWSDGEPYTADDVVFSYADVLSNRELYPVMPTMFTAGQENATIRKIDDHTVEFGFAVPNGVFLQDLATADGGQHLSMPRHYLGEFHEDFADDIDAVVAREKAPSWVELLLAKNDRWANPERPTLNAWFPTTAVGEETRVEFERNPYYWKVDPEGSQLPYLDRVSYEVIRDLEVALLKTSNGDIHFNHPTFTGTVCTSTNKPVLSANREQGDYRLVDSVSSSMNEMSIGLNLNHKNPVLREVFQSRDFRIGLSYALNRREIIDTVYQRQGEPWQNAPRRESIYFLEEMATQYVEHDVDAANRHLDAAGFTDRDGDGRRLGPDGEPIRFSVGVVTEEPRQIDALQMARDYWRAVGIDMRVQVEDRTLHVDRRNANTYDAYVWTGDGGLKDGLINPGWYFPFTTNGWASLWGTWYLTGGEGGEEPPEAAREQMELYQEAKQTVDPDAQRDLFMQMLRVAQEQFWTIGTIVPVGMYGTVRNNFHNVPDWIPGSWLYPSPGPTRPEQYYLRD